MNCIEKVGGKTARRAKFRMLVQLLQDTPNTHFKVDFCFPSIVVFDLKVETFERFTNLLLQTRCMAFINSLVSAPANLALRLSIRFLFLQNTNLASLLRVRYSLLFFSCTIIVVVNLIY